MNENQNNNKKGNILGYLFLAWFILSIVGLIYFANVNGYITVIIFGQVFFFFGLIPLLSKQDRSLIGIPFVLIGLACIIIPILMMNSNLSKTINWDKVIPVLFCSCFIFVGLGMIFIPPIVFKKKREIYSMAVEAEVDELRQKNNLSSPIYKYTYNGIEYKKYSNSYSNFNVPSIGDLRTLYINPNEPDKAIESERNYLFFIAFGILYMSVGIGAELLIFLQ